MGQLCAIDGMTAAPRPAWVVQASAAARCPATPAGTRRRARPAGRPVDGDLQPDQLVGSMAGEHVAERDHRPAGDQRPETDWRCPVTAAPRWRVRLRAGDVGGQVRLTSSSANSAAIDTQASGPATPSNGRTGSGSWVGVPEHVLNIARGAPASSAAVATCGAASAATVFDGGQPGGFATPRTMGTRPAGHAAAVVATNSAPRAAPGDTCGPGPPGEAALRSRPSGAGMGTSFTFPPLPVTRRVRYRRLCRRSARSSARASPTRRPNSASIARRAASRLAVRPLPVGRPA